jgi:plasmid maintenance system antidote protein VapI
MKNLHNPHPGEILMTEFMEPFELTIGLELYEAIDIF